MRHSIFAIIFVFIFTTYVFPDDRIEGMYAGKLIYPDARFPMVSNFEINNNGEVWGDYSYKYKGKNYEGVFYEGKLDGQSLNIYWNDEFGEGWLDIEFNSDFTKFSGDWGAIENNKRLRKEGKWTGNKSF